MGGSILREKNPGSVVDAEPASVFHSSRHHLRWQRVGSHQKEKEEQSVPSSAAAEQQRVLAYYGA